VKAERSSPVSNMYSSTDVMRSASGGQLVFIITFIYAAARENEWQKKGSDFPNKNSPIEYIKSFII